MGAHGGVVVTALGGVGVTALVGVVVTALAFREESRGAEPRLTSKLTYAGHPKDNLLPRGGWDIEGGGNTAELKLSPLRFRKNDKIMTKLPTYFSYEIQR